MLTSHRESQPFRHDHVALNVKDLQVSRDFYESLGGRVVSKPSSEFMEIVLGEIRLHLVPTGGGGADAASVKSRIAHICLRVESVEDLIYVQERINSHPLRGGRTHCEVEDSPPLGEGGSGHVEECPPRKTLY